MTPPQPTQRSIEDGSNSVAAVRDLWPWRALNDTYKRTASETLGVNPSEVFATLSDPRHIEKELESLPEYCLVVLEVLTECGGRTSKDVLQAELSRRVACSEHHLEVSLDLLAARGLAARLTVSGSGPRGHLAALVEPCAGMIASRVYGVTSPDASPPADSTSVANAGRTRLRDQLAIVALTAHRKLRFTMSRSVNHSGFRSFLKDLGIEEPKAEAYLQSAIYADVLGAVGDRLSPFADRLRHAAKCGIDPLPVWKDVDHWLRDGQWVSVEMVARAFGGPRMGLPEGRVPAIGRDAAPNQSLLYALRELSSMAFVECVEAEGERWVRRPQPSTWAGDGHVTPSFDVLLGPGADLELVAVVALGAELKHVDRMLTLRLSPASVAAGLACGITGELLLDALEHVAPRPLPENVRAMLNDWTQRARLAKVRTVTLVEVDAGIADQLEKGPLCGWVVSRPARTVLALDAKVPEADLVRALQDHGLAQCRTLPIEKALRQIRPWDIPSDDDDDDVYDAIPSGRHPHEPPPPRRLGDPGLRSRVMAAKKAGFADCIRRLDERKCTCPACRRAAAEEATKSSKWAKWAKQLARLASEHGSRGERAIAQALEIVRTLWTAAEPTFMGWLSQLDEQERQVVEQTLLPSQLVNWLILTSKFQRRVLRRAGSARALLDHSERFADRTSELGVTLCMVLMEPNAGAALGAALDGAMPICPASAPVNPPPEIPARNSPTNNHDAMPSAPIPSQVGNRDDCLQAGSHEPISSAPPAATTRSGGAPAANATDPVAIARLFATIQPGTMVRLALRDDAQTHYEAVFEGFQRRRDGVALLMADPVTDTGRIVRLTDIVGAATVDA